LHYIVVKGKLEKEEANKFINNLNTLGVNLDKVTDKIFDELEKILSPKENTSQPKTY